MVYRSRAAGRGVRRLTVLLAAMLLWGSSGLAEPPGRVVLFSAADAQRLRVPADEWKPPRRSRAAAPVAGPRIEVKTPRLTDAGDGPVIETKTPATLAVAFVSNGAPVNMASLEVTAKKGIFSKSLTALLKPYVRGTALAVDGVVIPSGRFLIEIAIADQTGATTVETYRLQVDE